MNGSSRALEPHLSGFANGARRPWRLDERGGDLELEQLVRRALELIEEDPARPGLDDTPSRVAEALRRSTSGYLDRVSDLIGTPVPNEAHASLIVVRGIEVFSLCEQHLLPFFGTAHVGYIPSRSVLEVSDLARLVSVFARRLQVQERLTDQIADALMAAIRPRGTAVTVEARHVCTMMQGVEKDSSKVITTTFRGVFARSPERRAEFFRLIS
jgi:GTP cyclohydrolase IA